MTNFIHFLNKKKIGTETFLESIVLLLECNKSTMKAVQSTIKKKISFSGVSLHSGIIVNLDLVPAPINNGVVFRRKDIKNLPKIRAIWNNVKFSNLCTTIKNEKNHSVSTVEHLMFSLCVLGISNVFIDIDGPEVPILDGSSKIFTEEILKAGINFQDKYLIEIKINKKFYVRDQNKFIKYEPTYNNKLEIDYTLEYDDNLIKKQRKKIKNIYEDYKEIYKARTFCHQEDLEKIFAMGLAKGGSLDNAVVISGNKVLNQEGLRYRDEFVRHKILDCVGDLFLSGFFLKGKITCNQGGHHLTAKLLNKIFTNKKNFEVN